MCILYIEIFKLASWYSHQRSKTFIESWRTNFEKKTRAKFLFGSFFSGLELEWILKRGFCLKWARLNKNVIRTSTKKIRLLLRKVLKNFINVWRFLKSLTHFASLQTLALRQNSNQISILSISQGSAWMCRLFCYILYCYV